MPPLSANQPSESIFICYRRQDSGDTVDRIYQRLKQEFPRNTLFRDLDSIPPGADFPARIKQALQTCCIVLVVIGPDWYKITTDKGRRRLDEQNDPVRVEVEAALSTPATRVVPILARFASMPNPEELPESIRPVATRNGLSIRPDPYFRDDIERLMRFVRDAIAESKFVSPLSGDHCDELLKAIEEGKVIPVLGPSLATIEINGRICSAADHLAKLLAEELGVDSSGINPQRPLEDVAVRFTRAHGEQWRLLLTLGRILQNIHIMPPPALHALAKIGGFSLFITTGFDRMLETVLKEIRNVTPDSISYTPKNVLDVDGSSLEWSRPVVFHLCGMPEALSCALTEEDWLDFAEALQSLERQPQELVAELRGRVLLFLGGGHPSGFVRWFLRWAHPSRLGTGGVHEFLGMSVTDSDGAVLKFLQNRSPCTIVFADDGGAGFLEELHLLWHERHSGARDKVPLALLENRSPIQGTRPTHAAEMENPWIGPIPYSEQTANLFFGRENEINKLFRCVRRHVGTLLFGRSGVGKSSLLEAGLIPILRDSGYFPALIRLDYSAGALPFRDQVLTAIESAVSELVMKGPPHLPGETLWEFFHRRTAAHVAPDDRVVTTVLVFDHFEQCCVLGAATHAGRQRTDSLVTELGDLLENRVPASVIEAATIGRRRLDDYDLSLNNYRVVISCREDLLADIDQLLVGIPSLRLNRLRILPLNGCQAVEAVMMAAPGIVDPLAARLIVRTVAGAQGDVDAPLNELTVEPSMLSVFCLELNKRRQAARAPKISAEMLKGGVAENLLKDFYESCFIGQPPALRLYLEENLLTPAGVRTFLALDNAKLELFKMGTDESALDKLIGRRLLSVEVRGEVRYIEFTHNVLVPIIMQSRTIRAHYRAREEL